jgi:hypothetical protein
MHPGQYQSGRNNDFNERQIINTKGIRNLYSSIFDAAQLGVTSMKRHLITLGLATVTTAAMLAPAKAETVSSQAEKLLDLSPTDSLYQSTYESVQKAFDEQSADYGLAFDDWFAINSFINNETAAYGSDGAKLQDLVAFDLANLTWKAGARDVEVFFINEGAGYRNRFGYSTALPMASGDQALRAFWETQVKTIWADTASLNSILPEVGPLALGQGYKIGDVTAGEIVNFYLRNGYSGTGNVFDSLSATATRNGDGLQHVTTYFYEDLLVLAYEDIYGGGDQDYNDVVIAVRGLVDAGSPTATPEPTSGLVLFGLGALGILLKQKQVKPI